MDYLDFFQEAVFRNIPQRGLYLVANNTGTGKTSAAVAGMVRLAMDMDFSRRQMFVTIFSEES